MGSSLLNRGGCCRVPSFNPLIDGECPRGCPRLIPTRGLLTEPPVEKPQEQMVWRQSWRDLPRTAGLAPSGGFLAVGLTTGQKAHSAGPRSED